MRIAAIVALSLALPGAARAQQIGGEVRAGGGYDSNPALAADPGNRRRPEAATPARDDGVFRIVGMVAGTIGDPHAGSARFDLDGRVFGRGEVLFAERLTIGGTLAVDDARIRCSARGTRLDVTMSEDDAWGLGARCGVLGLLPERFWIAGDLDAGLRAFDAGQLDGLFGGSVSAGWSNDVLAIELGFDVVRRESDDRDSERFELTPWTSVLFRTQYAGGSVAYALVAREFDRAQRSGREHLLRVDVWGMPIEWLGAYAELDVGYAEGGAQALAYDRVQITAGVRLVIDWRARPASTDPAIVDGRVHFSFDLPGAARAAIVGDWNGWTEAALERRDGRFEGSFTLPPGRHEYHLVVDGAPMRPPGAERYTSDGFGGENAVIEVPD